ncbi:hypothetical protein [Planotetraspora sp. GP83]|uniref:hypothetical protein n=1 Tax=Planotetraspora sp. GP83 TaxID=3156264 RepID=UPI003515DB69
MPDPEFSPPEFPRDEPPGRRAPRRLLLGVATAVVVATGAGVAVAGTSAGQVSGQGQPTPVPTETVTAPGVPSPPAPEVSPPAETASPPAVPPGPPSPSPTSTRPLQGPFGALHGQLVVRTDGGYQTVTTQTGLVTSIEQTSISVRSEDGFARTYTIGDNTRVSAGREGLTGVKSGDTVWVISTGQGSSAAAVVITDLSRPPWPPWAAHAPETASPTATATVVPPSPEATAPTAVVPPPSPETTGVPPASPVPSETVSPETIPPTG